jgi:plastocyanin
MNRRVVLGVAFAATIVIGACSAAAAPSAASPAPSVAAAGPSVAAPSAAPASLVPAPTPTPAPATSTSVTPNATLALASQAAARCAETPDAVPSATVQWNIPVVGGEPTIKAGQAVAFITTGPSPTVTEGTDGQPAANACIDKTVGSAVGQMAVVVTFYQPGDYNITCRKIPGSMHTVVHVH